MSETTKEVAVELVLNHIGITHENVRQDAFNHWFRFVDFVKANSGKDWKHEIRPKLRSWIGVDFRYIDDYLLTCLTWKIMDMNDGILIYLGIPKIKCVDCGTSIVSGTPFNRCLKCADKKASEKLETNRRKPKTSDVQQI